MQTVPMRGDEAAQTRDFIQSLCGEFQKHNYIDPSYYEHIDVKRGLRNADGTGVMAGITQIGNVQGYYIQDGERVPMEGRLIYRGISIEDLIHGFISTVNAATDVDRDWQRYVQQQKQQELEQIIAEEKLKPAEAQRFVANAFRDGALKTTGTDVDQILPPVSRFGGGNRTEKKKTIIQRLAQFFEKYFAI